MSNPAEHRVTRSVISPGDDAHCAALGKFQQRTGLKKVDIVNRAVQLYEFVEAQMREGNELVVRAPDGTDRLVKIF